MASGRPTYGVAPLAEILELQKYEGYILSYNGGEIIDWKTGEMMYENVLDPDILPYLYKCATDNHFAIVTYDGKYVLTEYPEDEYVLKEAILNVMTPKKVDHFLEAIKFPIAKCLIVGEPTSTRKQGNRHERIMIRGTQHQPCHVRYRQPDKSNRTTKGSRDSGK